MYLSMPFKNSDSELYWQRYSSSFFGLKNDFIRGGNFLIFMKDITDKFSKLFTSFLICCVSVLLKKER